MVSDSPLTASIRPAGSHLLLTPCETDLALPHHSCTQQTDTRSSEKKKKTTLFNTHIWCRLSDAFKKKEKKKRRHICFFIAAGTIMSLLTTLKKALKSLDTGEVLIQRQDDR